MSTQPQLLQIPLDAKDVVYTPDWVARDMVGFFKPSGRILEPASGDGAILKYLPGADWCEIEKGRDFFACHERYDWIVGNPPYSSVTDWLLHSYEIADNVLFLIPSNTLWNSMTRMRKIAEFGGMIHTRLYGNGTLFGKEFGFPVCAVHIQRDYRGPMYTSFYGDT